MVSERHRCWQDFAVPCAITVFRLWHGAVYSICMGPFHMTSRCRHHFQFLSKWMPYIPSAIYKCVLNILQLNQTGLTPFPTPVYLVTISKRLLFYSSSLFVRRLTHIYVCFCHYLSLISLSFGASERL